MQNGGAVLYTAVWQASCLKLLRRALRKKTNEEYDHRRFFLDKYRFLPAPQAGRRVSAALRYERCGPRLSVVPPRSPRADAVELALVYQILRRPTFSRAARLKAATSKPRSARRRPGNRDARPSDPQSPVQQSQVCDCGRNRRNCRARPGIRGRLP